MCACLPSPTLLLLTLLDLLAPAVQRTRQGTTTALGMCARTRGQGAARSGPATAAEHERRGLLKSAGLLRLLDLLYPHPQLAAVDPPLRATCHTCSAASCSLELFETPSMTCPTAGGLRLLVCMSRWCGPTQTCLLSLLLLSFLLPGVCSGLQ